MPVPVSAASWTGSLWWLIGLIVASFAVSWIFGNKWPISRTAYIGVLSVLTAGLSVGYVAWLGVGTVDLLTARWGWGLLAALVAGVVPAIGMTRLVASHRRAGPAKARALVWEGLVYGVAEGVLLSALPAFMTWQLVHSLGWSGPQAAMLRWILPIAASVVVIVVHHLGYWEYRNRLLIAIVVGCGLLTVGYLVTASVFAAAIGHVVMHAAGIWRGAELPPHRRPAVAPPPPVRERVAAGR